MGHTAEANERNYTFERTDYCESAREKINQSRKKKVTTLVTTPYATKKPRKPYTYRVFVER